MRFTLDNAVTIDDMNQINPSTNPMTFYTNEWDVKNPGVPMPTNPPDNTYSKQALYGLNGQNSGHAPSAMMGHSGGNLNYTDFNQQNEFQYVEQDSLNKLSMNDYLSQNKMQEQMQRPEVKQKMVRFMQEKGPQMQSEMKQMGQEMRREVKKAVKEIKREEIEDNDSDNDEESNNGHVFLLGSIFLLVIIYFVSKKYGFKI
jgi:acyl carrier protein